MYFTSKELAEFGVERVDGKYYIPCEICGRKIRKTQFSLKRNYVCDYCKGLIKEKAKIAEELQNVQTKHEKRFEDAVKELCKQVDDAAVYERAIEIAKTRCERYGSIPEAMVAIELIKLKYKIIPQQHIKGYRVDFAIPDSKLVIEVDGGVYHKRVNAERECKILSALGIKWDIIHIPAELIRKDITKLKDVIELYRKN